MFFQFSPPVRRVEKKPTSIVYDAEQLSTLSLLPFSPIPKLAFDNVVVGTKAVQKLAIKNPLNQDIPLSIHLDFPDEVAVELNWVEHFLPRNSEVVLELAWTPKTEGAWRYVFHLTGGSRIQRDIPIVFRSVIPKKNKANMKSKTLTKRAKSPRKNTSLKRNVLPDITNATRIISGNDKISNCGSGKENTFAPELTYVKNHTDRRETYIISNQKSPQLDDSLEMKSPNKSPMNCNPSHMARILQSDSFIFTPISTPSNEVILGFNPDRCSTEAKPINYNITTNARQVCLFSDKNSSDDVQPESNISTETYIKGNISSETYTKADLSAGTYIKDTSVGDVAPLSLSPINSLPSIVLTTASNTSYLYQAHRPLLRIVEEPSIGNFSTPCVKRKGDRTHNVTPAKKANLSVGTLSNWSLQGGNAFRIARQSTGLTINKGEVSKQETSEVVVQNPFLMSAVNLDPFMTSSQNENWIEEQENNFKKWLNALLTPPAELHSNEEGHPVDVVKLWTVCKNKEVAVAPTVETVCNRYHTNSRLSSLRKLARNLFRSKNISDVLTKVLAAVDCDKISVRPDKSIHLDLALQAEIMSILLSYNPLWLRIGLETIYNVIIPLNSNSDLMGLTSFLSERFFKHPYLLKKYKTVHCLKYNAAIKKFILKKFFTLVYFLDQAKDKKLISHDPCLFCKNSPIKESRAALLKFARECLSAVGDITRYLRYFNYVVSHKQTYINEFDYAVNCLGGELRDGVRLTRVMELILLRNDLSKELRVPAISKLQKIHNMKIVFNSLEQAGFEILYDISPKDIVNGHKEKTLSFLWQIIYKFQAPYIIKSVTSIQKWWRSKAVVAKRLELDAVRHKKNIAAGKIQTWYRRQKLAFKLYLLSQFAQAYIHYLRENRACTKIQSYVKMYWARKQFLSLRKTVIGIQTYARTWLINNIYKKQVAASIVIQSYVRMFFARKHFQLLKYCVLFVEDRYIANKMMRIEREQFEKLKYSTLLVQRVFRANKLAREARHDYNKLKSATIVIQRRFRANILRDFEYRNYNQLKVNARIIQTWYRSVVLRNKFLKLKAVTIIIQRRYRANVMTRTHRQQYIELKSAVIAMQRRYRANATSAIQRNEFCRLKQAVIFIQRRYRARLAMRVEMEKFHSLKNTAIVIQRRYRANIKARVHKQQYIELKSTVVAMQRRYRANVAAAIQRNEFCVLKQAAVFIQARYKAKLAMRVEMNKFHCLKKAAIIIQRRYRANIKAKIHKQQYIELKSAVVAMQRRYRANAIAKKQRYEFCRLKQAVIFIQVHYRAKLVMRVEMDKFHILKEATIVIQRRYRAKLAMNQEAQKFKMLREATVTIQRHYRASVQRRKFLRLKQAAITIQRRWNAKLRMLGEMHRFQQLKKATITLQRYYRARLAMKVQMNKFKALKDAVIIIQRRYRSTVIAQLERTRFQGLRHAAIFIQQKYRAKLLMKNEFKSFTALKHAAITVQTRYRARLAMKLQVQEFNNLKHTCIVVQRRYRAQLAMKHEMATFKMLRMATLTIQRHYRATVLAKLQRTNFVRLKQAATTIQRCWRAKLLMRDHLQRFQLLKKATITIQRYYRARLAMRLHTARFKILKAVTVIIQRLYRSRAVARLERYQFQKLKQSVIFVQQKYRAKLLMRIEMKRYTTVRNAAITLQTRYRARLAMKAPLQQFEELRHASLVIQRRFRANLLMNIETSNFIKLKQAAVMIQRRFRANKLMAEQKTLYEKFRTAVIFIQRRYRAQLAVRLEMLRYKQMQKAAIVIQRRFRAKLLMKHEVEVYAKKKSAVLMITKYCKKYLKEKRRKENELRVVAVVMIQKYVRRFLVRKQYAQQLAPEAIAARKKLRQQSAAAAKIQAAWKGYKCRSIEDPLLEKIRIGFKDATTNAVPEKTLGCRRDNAIILLSGNPSISQIIRALEDLDFITRRCKATCTQLSVDFPTHLYRIIFSTNRSPPEMQAGTAATLILINLYKYEPTRRYTWLPEHLNDMVTTMLHCCDKEDPLFPTLCTLIWLFAQTEEYKRIILETPNLIQKMNRVATLCLRKEKMVSKVNVKYESIFIPREELYMPTLTPDWGLEYPSRPRTFHNSVHAYKCLKLVLQF